MNAFQHMFYLIGTGGISQIHRTTEKTGIEKGPLLLPLVQHLRFTILSETCKLNGSVVDFTKNEGCFHFPHDPIGLGQRNPRLSRRTA